ncbi:acyltransferase 3, partial [Pseudomonas syringae pv. japonica str. M301072]
IEQPASRPSSDQRSRYATLGTLIALVFVCGALVSATGGVVSPLR